MKLMTNADENEWSYKDVGHWVGGYEHQDPVCVGSKPHVILAHEELQGYASEPGKEGRVACPEDAHHVPEHDEACDLWVRKLC